jgi:hypothetical protein
VLIIRAEQMAALAEALEARFEQDLVDLLRRDGAPALAGLPDAEWRAAIHEGRLEARRQGFASRDDARAFLHCVGRHGRGFYRDQAWAAEILADPSLSPAHKLRRLAAGGA